MRWWLVVCLVFGSASLAQAQARSGHKGASDTPQQAGASAGYEETVKRALDEFELANYAEARSVLLEAHGMYPNARTLRALGMVEFELKNYASSVGYLEQSLDASERPLTPEQRREAERLLARANGYIGRYALSLRPTNASLLIDGQPVRPDAQGLLLLPVGDHELEASAPEHRTLRRTLNVVGGRRQALDLVLMPRAADESRAAPSTPAGGASARSDTPVYKKWWLWTTIGVVVAAGAATGIILATRQPEPKDPNGGSLGRVVHLLSWK
jgi:tetratricopeptide (TPR) repeat protein